MAEREDDSQPRLRAALGLAARILREARDLTQEELAALVPCNRSYISRVEGGGQLPSDMLVGRLDVLLKADGLLVELLDAARDAAARAYRGTGFSMEAKASRIQLFTSTTIPGLLQIPDYSRALFKSYRPGETEEHYDRAVAVRVKRQDILKRAEPPLLWTIVDEAAIRRLVGGRACMHRQLAHLLSFADSAHVMIQLVPFDAGEHGFMGGSFALFTTDKGESVAYMESYGSGEWVGSAKRVLHLTHLFDVQRSRALDMPSSLELIRKYQKEYE